MLTIRRADERGHAKYDWLDTWHTFSFADYYDPRHMGFRTLRVINDDTIAPGGGFGTHAHHDMEIITYVLSGALQHRDNMGHTEVIRAGEMQRMSAGAGIEHSEANPSRSEPVHLLQIWITPERQRITPEYEQKMIAQTDKHGQLRLVVSHDARENSMKIHQDVDIYAAILRPTEYVKHRFKPGRYGWIQIARGSVILDGNKLEAGDGATLSNVDEISIKGIDEAELLLFDLA